MGEEGFVVGLLAAREEDAVPGLEAARDGQSV
jgi:hypothetical protein